MQAPFKHIVADQTLWLSPSRIIYWEDEQAVIISDLHFGKTGHFRKSGIAIPQSAFRNDMQRLFEQIQHFQPRKIIIVGDMFHSKANKELEFFVKWRNDHAHLEIILVKGNHDILQTDWYEQSCIQLTNPSLYIKEFCFVHDLAIFQNPEMAAGPHHQFPLFKKTNPNIIILPAIFTRVSFSADWRNNHCAFPVFISENNMPFFLHSAISPASPSLNLLHVKMFLQL